MNNTVAYLDESTASGWHGSLYAFLAEKQRRSGSMRTVLGYSRMLNDFFGRGGKILAENQKSARLKFEVLVPVISEESPTAVCSFNWHQDHFGQVFGIKTPDGAVANTACLGFGMERVCMALFKHHGFDPKTRPAHVREKLWTS